MAQLASARRVVVTGLGLVTPLGVGVRSTWSRLVQGESGLVSLHSAPPSGVTRANQLVGDQHPVLQHFPQYDTLPSTVAGLVPYGPYSQGRFDPAEWLQRGDTRKMALCTQYAMAAAEQALVDADWKPTNAADRLRTGVCIGSGMGSLEDILQNHTAYQQRGHRKVSPMFIPKTLINMAAGHVSMRYGFQGPNHAASTACTTGAHSIGDATRFIQFGDADVMVAGATEASVHPLALAGFARAQSLSTGFNDRPTEASRPFDDHRDGFVIGEGSGVVVLEELAHAKARNATIYAEVKGYGLSADAHHITAPPEDGQGAALAMHRALSAAQVSPNQVDYVNAHATSTPQGDVAENRAIKAVFHGSMSPLLAISSTKGAIGHLLGAAGAVEAIFTIMALHTKTLPPTLNCHSSSDPNSEFTLNYIPQESQRREEIRAALCNSFGFGGTNASLCFLPPQ